MKNTTNGYSFESMMSGWKDGWNAELNMDKSDSRLTNWPREDWSATWSVRQKLLHSLGTKSLGWLCTSHIKLPR